MARRGKPVIIVIQGDDKASNVMEKVQLGLRDFESRAKRTDLSVAKLRHSWIAATAAVGAMAAALFKLAAVTAEQERVEKRLEAVYRTTGGTVGLSTTALEDYATALGRATVVGDEAILKIESILLTFRKVSGDTFKGATELVFDMAEVMETDAKSAALQLGKALNDPIKGISALTRVGVSFTEAQKAQIKQLTESNDVMGAQQVILGELRSEFGGAAKAAGQTFGGQVAILKNNFVDLAQEIGKMNDGPLTVAVRKWNDWAVAAVDALARVNKYAGTLSLKTLTEKNIIEQEAKLQALNRSEAELVRILSTGAPGADSYTKALEKVRDQQNQLMADITQSKKILSSGINLGEKKTTPGPVAPDTGTMSPFKPLPGGPDVTGEQGLPSTALLDARRNLEDSYRQERLQAKITEAQQISEIEMDAQSISIENTSYAEITKTRIAKEQTAQRIEASRMGLQALATAFPQQKAFARGEVVLSGIQAVQNALATKPFFPTGLAMGALAVAKASANLRAINSTGIHGGGGTSSYTYGGASATVPQAPAKPAPAGPIINIHVLGGVYGDIDGFARELVPSIEKAYEDGVS